MAAPALPASANLVGSSLYYPALPIDLHTFNSTSGSQCGSGTFPILAGKAQVVPMNVAAFVPPFLYVQRQSNAVSGIVVDKNGVGVPGAALTLSSPTGVALATGITDITGSYFLGSSDQLTTGPSYTVTVTTFPSPFLVATPGSQSFIWNTSEVTLAAFALQ